MPLSYTDKQSQTEPHHSKPNQPNQTKPYKQSKPMQKDQHEIKKEIIPGQKGVYRWCDEMKMK